MKMIIVTLAAVGILSVAGVAAQAVPTGSPLAPAGPMRDIVQADAGCQSGFHRNPNGFCRSNFFSSDQQIHRRHIRRRLDDRRHRRGS